MRLFGIYVSFPKLFEGRGLKSAADWRDLPSGAELKQQEFSEQCSQAKAIKHSQMPSSSTTANNTTY